MPSLGDLILSPPPERPRPLGVLSCRVMKHTHVTHSFAMPTPCTILSQPIALGGEAWNAPATQSSRELTAQWNQRVSGCQRSPKSTLP